MTNIDISYKGICCIYLVRSPSNRVYVGQTWDLHHRYKSGVSKHQRLLFRSYAKYGADLHSLEILKQFDSSCVTQSDLDYWETYFINEYRTNGFKLLNIREGGARGKLSEETKKILGLRKKAWVKLNPDKAKVGVQAACLANTGKKRSAETKKQMSDSASGKLKSKEHCKNISEAKKGKTTKRKGQIYSEQALQNIREGIKKRRSYNKPVLQFDQNGNFIKEWPSTKIASETLKIHRRTIGGCLVGYKHYHTAGGYIWKFKT